MYFTAQNVGYPHSALSLNAQTKGGGRIKEVADALLGSCFCLVGCVEIE